jgi:uncharacterized protein YxjI
VKDSEEGTSLGENPFGHSNYLLRKQLLKVFGGTFRIYDPSGALTLFASMKAFKLKEDITIFADEGKTMPLLGIKARQIIDFSAAYDVYDAAGQKLGALKRRGWKSMLKDEWIIMDAADNDIGLIQEDSWLLATIRRFVTNIIPQNFNGTVGGMPVFEFRQGWNPFAGKIHLNFTMDFANRLDRRLGIAAAVLLSAIESRQD